MLHHPKIEAARALLNVPPETYFPNIDDEGVRMVAGAFVLRRLAEEAAETLISLLDELDAPSEDLEETGDDEPDEDGEPSLAGLERHPGCFSNSGSRVGSQERWWRGRNDDREEEHDGREPDESGYGDEDGMQEDMRGEPSLGWTDFEARYGRYPEGFELVEDGEAEHDGREPDPDDEDGADTEPNGDEIDYTDGGGMYAV